MDLDALNERIAAKLGWEKQGMGYTRLVDGLSETTSRLPDYTSNLQLAPQLWEFAAKRNIEFSLYMVLYTTMPVFMASFVQGMRQHNGKDSDPMLAIAKAFDEAFAQQ